MPRKASKTRSATPVDAHVGKRVRERRTRLDMSQTALAQACGITFQQVQKYENGANRVSASRLWQFAAIFGVPVDYFFEGLSRHKISTETMQTIDAERRGNVPRSGEIDAELVKLARALAKLTDARMKAKLMAMIAALSR